MKNEKELQKKYFYGQLLKQQAAALLEEKQLIDARMNEINVTTEAVKKIGDMKKNDMMWSPIGSGAFMISNAEDTENVLISVGAGVLIKTGRSNAMRILESRAKELEAVNGRVTEELAKFAQQLNEVENEMQEMIQAREHEKEIRKKPKKSGEKTKGTGG